MNWTQGASHPLPIPSRKPSRRQIERLTAENTELRRQLAEAGKSIARKAATIRGLTRPEEE